jgi:hypothetical protein
MDDLGVCGVASRRVDDPSQRLAQPVARSGGAGLVYPFYVYAPHAESRPLVHIVSVAAVTMPGDNPGKRLIRCCGLPSGF